jgi:hypothetical protein
MSALLTILNMFSGPLGGLAEKGILALVTYLFASGHINGDAGGVAAALYAAFSAVFTAVTRSQTAKIQSVNAADNGVVVVPQARASTMGLSPVNTPASSSTFGG